MCGTHTDGRGRFVLQAYCVSYTGDPRRGFKVYMEITWSYGTDQSLEYAGHMRKQIVICSQIAGYTTNVLAESVNPRHPSMHFVVRFLSPLLVTRRSY